MPRRTATKPPPASTEAKPKKATKAAPKKANGARSASRAKAGRYSLFVGNTFGSLCPTLDGEAIAGVEAGKPIVVSYRRQPEDLGRPDLKVRSVKMHYRVDGQEMPPVEVRLPTAIDVPPTAKGGLEYWFEIDTESGETLWDSDFGKNYSFDVQPR